MRYRSIILNGLACMLALVLGILNFIYLIQIEVLPNLSMTKDSIGINYYSIWTLFMSTFDNKPVVVWLLQGIPLIVIMILPPTLTCLCLFTNKRLRWKLLTLIYIVLTLYLVYVFFPRSNNFKIVHLYGWFYLYITCFLLHLFVLSSTKKQSA